MHDPQATVVAVATPPGRGGVGCIRLSGPDAHRIGASLFRPSSRAGSEGEDGTATRSSSAGRMPRPGDPPAFGRLLGRAGAPVDRGYLWLLPADRAFTGEATAELWPHGSPPVLAELVLAALAAGAVAADPGEFTYRALRHGRLDLTRAEAVRDLVEARTAWQARLAFAQAEGAVARRVEPLREALEEWIARGEAAVEFVEESDAHLTRAELHAGIEQARATCDALIDGFRRAGRLVRGGATLAIVGRPNAGKSSLFNRLLAADRAIVTEVPGTTRDTLEEELDLDGVPLRLIDTAGLREAGDAVEAEGVRRAERARREADLVLVVLDRSRPAEPEERDLLEHPEIQGGRVVVAANKCDLDAAWDPADRAPGAVEVSAKTGAGIEALRAELRARLVGEGPLEDPILTDARHADAMERARDALDRAAAASAEGLSEELLLEDLRDAMRHLGAIVGVFDVEDLYDRIFSTFCIGK